MSRCCSRMRNRDPRKQLRYASFRTIHKKRVLYLLRVWWHTYTHMYMGNSKGVLLDILNSSMYTVYYCILKANVVICTCWYNMEAKLIAQFRQVSGRTLASSWMRFVEGIDGQGLHFHGGFAGPMAGVFLQRFQVKKPAEKILARKSHIWYILGMSNCKVSNFGCEGLENPLPPFAKPWNSCNMLSQSWQLPHFPMLVDVHYTSHLTCCTIL